jgi:medium-chain acyl-[acyl-carrier-protein] hydrolase
MGATSSWLRHLPADAEPAMRLLCFPHAGGGASSFNGWRRALPSWVELVKIQLPGREDRKDCAPYTRMDDLIPALFPEVLAMQDRPLAIYGHSMGALVAFEVTRELRRRGHPLPVVLVISGRRAPQRPLRASHVLHDLPEQALVDRILDLGGIAPALLTSPKWRDHYLPTIRADLCLSDIYTYRDEPALDCPLHAFLGVADNLVFRDDWEAWSEIASGEFSRSLLPGGHFFSKAGQAELIARIKDLLTAILVRDGADRKTGTPARPTILSGAMRPQ